ncbi:Alpha/beta hydrolase fold-1 [Roridomyces roridus]|uniref:Alpha/beta hydrolase fold-1 n=1 Tax=Roridomyces roridus TaxID=1738132 RepID=A0AAD7FK70_9AGAR|nr:Alpha/beta hydrolase fold-1 [Roridomyces roridus]
MTLRTDSVIFDCPQNVHDPPGHILKMSAKRYRRHSADGTGLTLLFAHCVGAHKEQWEPTIARIFERCAPSTVSEAWAVDWQNHGDSAVLNRELLSTSPSRVYGVSAIEWGEAVAAFIRSPHLRGKRIVPIGHSAGAGTLVLTMKDLPVCQLVYPALILVEPTIIFKEDFYREIEERASTMDFVVTATLNRRERWKSREEAYSWMAKRVPWDVWDPRVLHMPTEHNLESTPDGGVITKADRRQEALCYVDTLPHFAAAEELRRISSHVPVHFIWGKESVGTLVPENVKEAFETGIAASVRTVEGGHLIVQEKPDAVADAICDILDTIVLPRSKL